MKIKACAIMHFSDGVPFFRDIDAEIVDVAPHLANVATFGVHDFYGSWRVTNLETGALIDGSVSQSRAYSIRLAMTVLSTKTTEHIESGFRKFLANLPKDFLL